MKRNLLLFLFFISLVSYAQTSSKAEILYKSKDIIVLNDGVKYKVVIERPYYYVNDAAVQQYKQVGEKVLQLNRVLILKNEKDHKRLIEWLDEGKKVYESSNISLAQLRRDYLYDLENISVN